MHTFDNIVLIELHVTQLKLSICTCQARKINVSISMHDITYYKLDIHLRSHFKSLKKERKLENLKQQFQLYGLKQIKIIEN